MTIIKTKCADCLGTFAIVDDAPTPDSLCDQFMGLAVSSIPDPVVGPDENCPHCGSPVNDSDDLPF